MRTRGAGPAGGRVPGGVGDVGMLAPGIRHPWSRYVDLGDSFTEGVGDPDPHSPGGVRGWADRVAEELATGRLDFAYANLAVRGLLLKQILEQQTGPALEPDLITLSVGGNDLVFRDSDPDKLADRLDVGVKALSASGATIVLFTGPDCGSTPVLGRNHAKVALFNENIHAIASRHGVVTAELWSLRQLEDRRMWDPDRLHLSPLGHHTVARAVLDVLPVPHALPPSDPGERTHGTWRQARAGDLQWTRTYLIPWAWAHLRPGTLEPHPRPKRPEAGPVRTQYIPAPVPGRV